MEFAGEFETHITLRLTAANELFSLQEWGKKHGLKCLHIVLDRGTTVSQPMLTRRGHGILSGQLTEARRLSHALQSRRICCQSCEDRSRSRKPGYSPNASR